jgi:hypothetical protein
VSLTIQGLLVILISLLLKIFHIPFVPSEVDKTVSSLLEVVGIGIAWYGRYRQGNITVFGRKLKAQFPKFSSEN